MLLVVVSAVIHQPLVSGLYCYKQYLVLASLRLIHTFDAKGMC